jgi:anti-anti-sigma regulatory factor
MNTKITRMSDTMVTAACDLEELVRGHDGGLVERISPLVRHESVLLDLTTVTRIDAAGIAALITLYGTARDAGHCFMVSNATPHVRELLVLVGLDRILLSQSAGHGVHANPCMQLSAA